MSGSRRKGSAVRIGELSARTGVSHRSLRYYEQQGMLQSTRTAGGHREYPDGAVDRVVRIQELFAAGLHSHTIAEILPCMRDADGGPSAQATPLLLRQLHAERARIEAMIRDLHRSRQTLDEVIAAAAGSS